MLLAEVLKILAAQTESLGHRRTDLYEKLFQGLLDEKSFGLEDIVKQIFSGSRPLNGALMRELSGPTGFRHLCSNIQSNLLTVIGNHDGLYEQLSQLLTSCPYTRAADTEKIMAACDPAQAAELSRFIASCIVYSSYNTAQIGKRIPLIQDKSVLNTAYMHLDTPAEALILKSDLWTAAQLNYIASHREGGRFYNLNIIERLLPQGYVAGDHFQSLGKTEDGTIAPLADLCAQSNDDIAIVGDGGIGKTTFLQHLMEEEFLAPDGSVRRYMGNRPVPFFIELNRCPDHIRDWYDGTLGKTNFITRYIGQIRENHSTLDSVSQQTLDEVEKELQRIPSDGKPQYFLLLDGFNEVRTGGSIRADLSNEISVLHTYANIRIITTSRETQAAYYASAFKNIRLVGLEEHEIIAHLEKCGLPQPVIGEAKNCDSLMRCLRIPLYLCMFSAEQTRDNFLPQTAGEILYCFFHKNSAFYNARARMSEARSSKLTEPQIALVLDFVVPYIGWSFENGDIFFMNEQKLRAVISEAMQHIQAIFADSVTNPFPDFQYSGAALRAAAESFYDQGGALDTGAILACAYDYLGIVYQYQINEGPFADRVRYAFCHHHFRDYFSAMWDVGLLSMLQCVTPGAFSRLGCGSAAPSSFRHFLDMRYWQTQKVQFISEILMEHRNQPQLNEKTLNWYLPQPEYDEARVLTNAIDYCRKLRQEDIETQYVLPNILSAILFGRKEYSGMDLSGLDLRKCCFFNINCSRRGKTRILAADFSRSILRKENFQPEDHQDYIMEYCYHGKQCFTIDSDGVIKCWDMLSGKLEFELRSADPLGISDFSSKGFMKVSHDGRWLAAKVQESCDDGIHLYVNLFDLATPDLPPKQVSPAGTHNALTYFEFTRDSRSLLILCDHKTVYCMDIETGAQLHNGTFDLYKQSELYADSANSPVFAYTAEYNTYETDTALMETWDNDGCSDYSSDEDDEDEFPVGIPCALCVLILTTGEMRTLYSYIGEPGVAPTISYDYNTGYFLLYNYEGHHIERFDCVSEQRDIILEELTEGQDTPPTELHPHPEHLNEYYIMYPNVCFDVAIDGNGNGKILMTYSIEGVEKLLPNSDLSGELEFKTAVAPTLNRFIVGNDSNTYEWDTENDALVRKYNCVYYNCTAFFTNTAKDLAILVHRHNGVSIFRGSPAKLYAQFCFHDPEYLIDVASYNDTHNLLALGFARPDHEKVITLDVTTSRERMIYSSTRPGETIVNMCFHEDGSRLLITTQYECYECELGSEKLATVVKVGPNERLAAGHYKGDEVEVAVVEHSGQEDPSVKPHCTYYRRNADGTYLHSWYYLMPELDEALFRYFLYATGDLGFGGSNDKDGFQQYWVTKGFFLERLPELKRFFKPKCYTWHRNRRLKLDKEFQPLEEIFVWHKAAITNQYSVGDSGFSYMYLADDMSEAIITDNRRHLLYQKPLQGLTYQQMKDTFRSSFTGVHRDTYWDLAIPWCDGSLIGCFESYKLTHVMVMDNKLLNAIEYCSGISMVNCKCESKVEDTGDESSSNAVEKV